MARQNLLGAVIGSSHEDVKQKPLVWQKASKEELDNYVYKEKPKANVLDWTPPKMHQEKWNDKEHVWESSFKTFVRNQQEKQHEQNWLSFNLYGDNKELVMTSENY